MLTVNLEKRLIKQNKKVLLPEELLSIKEYERLGDDLCESEVLSRVGLNQIAKEGKKKKMQMELIDRKLSKFDQERVFHISQIESICKKYHLRFLGTEYFKGSTDTALAAKISNFEIAHQVRCTGNNCRIVAPKSSFELEERPKDPLFFYDLDNDYWYLIHKWGNDLSIFRRAYSLLSNAFITWLIVCGIPSALVISFFKTFYVSGDKLGINPWGGFVIAGIIYTILTLIAEVVTDGHFRLVKKNHWESSYK